MPGIFFVALIQKRQGKVEMLLQQDVCIHYEPRQPTSQPERGIQGGIIHSLDAAFSVLRSHWLNQ